MDSVLKRNPNQYPEYSVQLHLSDPTKNNKRNQNGKTKNKGSFDGRYHFSNGKSLGEFSPSFHPR